MPGISVAVITKNESANIARCLESVQDIADELVVVDSHSTDNTREIAESFGARVILQSFLGYKEQKEFAKQQCRNTWILSLDADEALSVELRDAIRNARFTDFDAFQMSRLSRFCGQWIKHGSWYPDKKIRLFHRDSGYWGGHNPHDKYILLEGKKLGQLKGDILHYTFESFEQHQRQIEHFSTVSAQAMLARGKKSNWLKPYYKSAFRFFRNYILKAGFLDGTMGLYIARTSAVAVFKRYSKLQQLLNGEKLG
ncbi:MAG: glycosyltransferase family 2 protein [Luteibaculum sp.]